MGRVEARSQTQPGRCFTHPYNDVALLLRGRMPADTRKLKEDTPEASTDSSNPCYGALQIQRPGSHANIDLHGIRINL
jgi:hypothetical protein